MTSRRPAGPIPASQHTHVRALQASPTALELANEHPTNAMTVSDSESVAACLRFLDDHRVMVEPACGAALALLYSGRQRELFRRFDSVCVVVCGGGGVDLSLLAEWQQGFGL